MLETVKKMKGFEEKYHMKSYVFYDLYAYDPYKFERLQMEGNDKSNWILYCNIIVMSRGDLSNLDSLI